MSSEASPSHTLDVGNGYLRLQTRQFTRVRDMRALYITIILLCLQTPTLDVATLVS